jgi:hypothetical protein
MELILLICLTVISFVNLVFLFAISLFLVRFRDRVNNIFADLIEALEVMWGAVPTAAPPEAEPERPKTWDEKYEEELESITRRLRGDSGLRDLPDPVLSWGEPPALNLQNTDGLSIKDIAKSPMNANRVDRPE